MFDLTGYLSETDYDNDPYGTVVNLMFDVAEIHHAATGNTLDGFTPSPALSTCSLDDLREGPGGCFACLLLDEWHLDPEDDAGIADLWRRLENLRALAVSNGQDY